MAKLSDTTIFGNLDVTGTLALPSKSTTWLEGFSNSSITITDATDENGYHAWISSKNDTAQYMYSVGIYKNYFCVIGSSTSRIDSNTNGYDSGLFFDIENGKLLLNKDYEYLHTNNYDDYTPKKDGTGAYGTWNISIKGSAASLSSTLPVNKGGTGNTSFAANKLISYNGSSLVSMNNISVNTESIVINTSNPKFCVQNNNNTVDLRVTKNAGVYHNNTAGSKTAKWLIHIGTTGTVTANTSDRRKKKYIKDTTEYETISILKNIKIRNFIYKEDIGHDNLIQNGIFAQDLRDILKKYNIGNRPYLQWEYDDDRDDVYYDINAPEKEDMFYEINYSSMIPLLIKGWQINENKISHLKDKIKELEEM